MKLTNSQFAELLLAISASDEAKRRKELGNFIRLLRRNRKLGSWRQIVEIFEQKYNETNNILPVKISTGKKLEPSQQEEIKKSLETKYSKKIRATFEVVPKLIGGIKIQGPDFLIDNSINNFLNTLKNQA
ncbi:ATP synthase F1 subunit delta [Patescibacteria group bacterium]